MRSYARSAAAAEETEHEEEEVHKIQVERQRSPDRESAALGAVRVGRRGGRVVPGAALSHSLTDERGFSEGRIRELFETSQPFMRRLSDATSRGTKAVVAPVQKEAKRAADGVGLELRNGKQKR